MAYLSPDKIIKEDGLVINQKLTPDGYSKKPNKAMKPQAITVHNTGMISTASGTNPAEQYARATYPNGNMGYVAVHYWVFKGIIWQQLKDTEQGWHAGQIVQTSKRGQRIAGNLNTISIEIIGDDRESEETGKKLVALLCRRHSLSPLLDVYTHNFFMYGSDKFVQGARKNCPIYILDHWANFLKDVNTLNTGDKGYFEEGDTGEGVKKLQGDLAQVGFNPEGGIDGKFGPGTKKAVFAFQAAFNLEYDGTAGPQTLAKLETVIKAQIQAEADRKAAAEAAARKKAVEEAAAAAEKARLEAEEKKTVAPDGKHYKVVVQFGAFGTKENAEDTLVIVAAELKAKKVQVNKQEPIVKIILE